MPALDPRMVASSPARLQPAPRQQWLSASRRRPAHRPATIACQAAGRRSSCGRVAGRRGPCTRRLGARAPRRVSCWRTARSVRRRSCALPSPGLRHDSPDPGNPRRSDGPEAARCDWRRSDRARPRASHQPSGTCVLFRDPRRERCHAFGRAANKVAPSG